MASVEQFVQNMINMCNDNSYGYRLGGWGPKDYDCASSIITALRNAGFDTGSATYTGNMAAELCARGWTRLPVGTTLNRGDILLNEVNYVALYVGNNQLAEFSSDYDGVSGDSSGREASVHGYYNFPWDCILRYSGKDERRTTVMQCFIHVGNEGGMSYFDGMVIRPLATQKEMDVIQDVYRANNGKDMPSFQWTSDQFNDFKNATTRK